MSIEPAENCGQRKPPTGDEFRLPEEPRQFSLSLTERVREGILGCGKNFAIALLSGPGPFDYSLPLSGGRVRVGVKFSHQQTGTQRTAVRPDGGNPVNPLIL